MVERLRGMFALAVVDLWEHEVFMARDAFGEEAPLLPGRDGWSDVRLDA